MISLPPKGWYIENIQGGSYNISWMYDRGTIMLIALHGLMYEKETIKGLWKNMQNFLSTPKN